MRSLFAFLFLALSLSAAHAQEQERKLVDRLLKPDTELQNSAQNKKFVAAGTSIDKKAIVSSFSFEEKPLVKEFGAEREFFTKRFAALHFRDGEIAAMVQARTQLAKPANINSSRALSLRDAWGSERKVPSFRFAGARPFLDRGKSQKAISQYDTPLTIEQVRELLNRNK